MSAGIRIKAFTPAEPNEDNMHNATPALKLWYDFKSGAVEDNALSEPLFNPYKMVLRQTVNEIKNPQGFRRGKKEQLVGDLMLLNFIAQDPDVTAKNPDIAQQGRNTVRACMQDVPVNHPSRQTLKTYLPDVWIKPRI